MKNSILKSAALVDPDKVRVDTWDACVDFPIFDAKTRSFKKAVLGKAGGVIGSTDSNVVVVEALRNINLHLEHGDRVGLVGHNGAGKSTLLRLLSGIYEPTRGACRVQGRVAPVFDLGVGMDPEISGYENIIIRGMFLGMSRKEMMRKTDEIAEFTELGDYLEMPLRTYSTGMRVRVALGVVTSIDPEILILDEGIGAVDADFMRKARVRLQALVERSGILVFASHSNEFLAQLCDRALWIDHGQIRMEGGIEEVVNAYEGPDAAARVRKVLADLEADDKARPSFVGSVSDAPESSDAEVSEAESSDAEVSEAESSDAEVSDVESSDTESSDATPKVATPEDAAPRDATPEDATPEGATPEGATLKDTTEDATTDADSTGETASESDAAEEGSDSARSAAARSGEDSTSSANKVDAGE